MKKSDIFLIIFIATAGMVIAYFLCDAVMADIEPVSFKTVGAITAELDTPDPEIFNSAALNPTVETYVGSCVDPNQDGELDFAESVLCREDVPKDKTEEGDSLQEILEQITEENEENDGTTDEEEEDAS